MRLSEAEEQVIQGILDGRSNAEIAAARGRSVRTVANQAASAFRKLGVRSRSELATLWWSRHAAPARADTCVDTRAPAPLACRLTRREREVAVMTARGHTNKAIAFELGLGVSTVSWYLAGAMRKLGAGSRVELIRLCAGWGTEAPLAEAV